MSATRISSVDIRVVAAAMLGVTALAGGLALLDVGGPVRLVVTVAFFLVVPGWAIVAFARPAAALSSTVVAVSVAVSVALDVLVAQTMLLSGGWHPERAFAVLAVVSAALLVAHLVRA